MNKTETILHRIYKKLNINKDSEFCRKYDIKANTLSTWKKRDSIPFELIESISQNENISLDYILFGKDNNSTNTNNNEYKIEKLSLKASAGAGIENFEVFSDGYLYVPKWLFKTPQKEDSLKIIEVVGDSMEPTIEDGAFVIIDTTQKLISDGIYAILMGEEVLIKRLQIKPNGNILIKSDNPKYDDFCYDPKSNDVALRVIGKKILVMQ